MKYKKGQRTSCSLSLFYSNMLFFVFSTILGKAKQKEIALVTTAFKALLAVAKANPRLSGRKLNAGNIDNLIGKIRVHTAPCRI